ncbi:protein kinase [Actinoplanes sp. NBC_00393]|uniref:serine/threonine-protein kinase n=1 Tax=Actinoplanes sp. NBC_00393 TaxID=2975953 RepID=UPI002E1F286D
MRCLSGRYVLEDQVGRGGMAEVWRAHDRVLRRTVAVKVMSRELAAEAAPEQMRQEALHSARLCHPHIAGVYDYGETVENGTRLPFLVMEYVDGPTLAGRLAEGPLSWPEAVRICAEVADALAAAHEAGLVHRDIKPSNIMLAPAGVKVVDFGVAARTGHQAADAAGRVWGTPGYLPPEQWGDGQALPEGDVFALGLVLRECLLGRTARTPFTGPRPPAGRNRLGVPELVVPAGLPAAVSEIYRRCLAHQPADRPSAGEVAGVLRAAAEERAAAAVPERHRTTVATVRPGTTRPQPSTRRAGRSDWPRRTARLAAVLSVAVVAGLLAGQAREIGSSQQAAQAEPAETSAAPAAVRCRATYSSTRGADGRFAARLAVTNTGPKALRDWTLSFRVPDGQVVTGGVPQGRWSQDGERARVAEAGRLLPGATTTLSLRGRYDPDSSDLPAGFAVNGVTCAQVLTRVRGSRTPVQATVDGSRTRRARPTTRPTAPASTAEPSPRTQAPASAPPTSSPPPASPSASVAPRPSNDPTSSPSSTPVPQPSRPEPTEPQPTGSELRPSSIPSTGPGSTGPAPVTNASAQAGRSPETVA